MLLCYYCQNVFLTCLPDYVHFTSFYIVSWVLNPSLATKFLKNLFKENFETLGLVIGFFGSETES